MLKRSLIVSLGVFLVGSVYAPALDIMGPPTSGLDFGKWGAGVAYFHADEDLDLDLAMGFEGELQDVESDRYYAWVGYGLSDWWELYTRLGLNSLEVDDGDEFDDSHAFVGSLGTKVTFVRGDVVDWGFLIQGTWNQAEDDFSGPVDLSALGLGIEDADVDLDMDFRELQVAVGPVIKMDGFKIYGGPFFYCVDGEFESDIDGDGFTAELDSDIEEDNTFGGYAGVIVDLGSSAALTVEGLFTGDGWGVGAMIGWEF